MEQIIQGYNFVADLILQEWFIRTIGVAFFAWVTVVIIRAIKYGANNIKEKDKAKMKQRTKKYYLPANMVWSIVFTLRYSNIDLIKNKSISIDMLYWFLVYSFIAMGIHVIWTRGIAPFSDKRFKTNWLGG